MDFVEQIADPRLVDLYRYWASRRGNRVAPSRAEIDPTDIPRLLPHLLLIDMVDGGRRPRFRLVGTEAERHFGCPMTGRHLDELMHGAYLRYIQGLYDTLRERQAPVYSESAYSHALGREGTSRAAFHTCRLMLPLSKDGRTIDMVLAGQTFAVSHRGDEPTVLVTQHRFDGVACIVRQIGDEPPSAA